jgi:hypothetical protein
MDNINTAIAGSNYSIVLKDDGSVWSFGANVYGETGIGYLEVVNNEPTKILDNAKEIFSNGAAGFAIINDEEKTIWRWGSNYVDYVGVSDKFISAEPKPYIKDAKYIFNKSGYNLVIKQDDSLWIYGESEEKEQLYMTDGTVIEAPYKICDGVKCVSGTDRVSDIDITVVLKDDGCIYLAEYNENDDYQWSFHKIADNIKSTDNTVNEDSFQDVSQLKQGNTYGVFSGDEVYVWNGKIYRY